MLCGNPETLGDGSQALKLATNRPLVFVRDALRDHDQDEIWSWIREAYDRAGEVCDVDCTRIMDMSEAQGRIVHLVTVADLGTGGVLADQRLPSPGLNVLPMRINTRIRWETTNGPMNRGTVDPWRTLLHELGHLFGLQHFPAGDPPELMEPSISQSIIRMQPTEARVLAGWYGSPVSKPPQSADGGIVINPSKRTYSFPSGWTAV